MKKPNFKIMGYVKNLKERSEKQDINDSLIVITFNVEQFDLQGNRIPPVPVEMRGLSFTGSINEGDHVGINRKFREGKILRLKKLYNLTSKIWVSKKGKNRSLSFKIAIIFAWIFFAIIILAFIVLISSII